MEYLIRSEDGSDFIYHHGVKGMKWGVRRERRRQAKQNKRDVNDFENWMKRDTSLISLAALSTMDKKTAKQFKEYAASGKAMVAASLKKDYANRSIDITANGSSIARVKLDAKRSKDGSLGYEIEFLTKNGKKRIDEYLKGDF